MDLAHQPRQKISPQCQLAARLCRDAFTSISLTNEPDFKMMLLSLDVFGIRSLKLFLIPYKITVVIIAVTLLRVCYCQG